MANSLTKTTSNKMTFSNFITSSTVKAKINAILQGNNESNFTTSIISLVAHNPEIAKCDNATILASALLGESLKLSPSQELGQFYIVPFKENDKNGNLIRTVAQFQLGYKGYIQLAIRSGYYKKLNVLAIKEGELVNYNPLEETIEVNLIEDEIERAKAPTTGYYAMFEYKNGFIKTMYWSKAKMEAHALKYSQAYRNDKRKGYKYSFWTKDFDAMAYKTMLRQLISKWGIMSVDFQTALTKDMAVLENDKTLYVDNDFVDSTFSQENEIEEEVSTVQQPEVEDVLDNFD